jgi:hypothetical protein
MEKSGEEVGVVNDHRQFGEDILKGQFRFL